MLKRFFAWIGSLMRRRFRFWGQYGAGALPGLTLGVLSLSQTSFPAGVSTTGTIIGASSGSTIVGGNLPAGFSINSAARTWAWNGTPGSNGTLTLTESLIGYAPRTTSIDYVITVGSGGFFGKFDFSIPGQSALIPEMEDI
jgi:hypothetical protein